MVIFFQRRNKLYVLKTDEEGRHYMFVYDDRQVYVNNNGDICCIKCTEKIKYSFAREMSGECLCVKCSMESRGKFESWGFASVIGDK